MKRFGEKLRTLRTEHGLSIRKTARELGVHHSHISGIETNKHKPSAEFILKIAKFFSVSTDQLMDDDLELAG